MGGKAITTSSITPGCQEEQSDERHGLVECFAVLEFDEEFQIVVHFSLLLLVGRVRLSKLGGNP